MKNKRLLLLLICLNCSIALDAQDRRYTEQIFPSSTITNDVVYDTAPFINFPYHDENNTTTDDLVMDIYQPTGDAHDLRAAIIFVHAGGFALGNRNHDDMVAFCDSFARMGYVTATIDYRKGFYAVSNAGMHATRAAYRGLQDGRSAVRYLRANAASYGIDPSRVYMAGSSAGAFVALHSIFMMDPSEKPADAGAVNYSNLIIPFFHDGPDLGDFDRGSNLDQDGTPNGIISLWGALFGLDLLDPTENQPVFLAHGSADLIVPYGSGAPFSLPLFPTVYGSELIDSNMDLLGMTQKDTYFLPGEGHEFYGTSNGSWSNGSSGNMYWDSLLNKVTPFLWLQHKPTADFDFTKNDLEVDFSDMSMDALAWYWDFGDGNTSNEQNPSHNYAMEGNYEVRLFVQNDIQSWDEVLQPLEVLLPLPLTWQGPLKAHYANKNTQLNWTVAEQVNNERFMIEHSRDGRDFIAIGSIDAGPNQAEAIRYTFDHLLPAAGIHYYRIKQVDFDGRFSYSNIAQVEVANQAFVFYPNPAKDYIRLEQNSDVHQLAIYDVQGRLVLSQVVADNQLIPIAQLPAGMYLIQIDESILAQKLMVK